MTPRRRISPRARRRYRAVKDFFKRAIGGSSQIDMETNSSTAAVNVTDLKHKIVGLEQQLSAVSRTCREFMYLEGSRRDTQSLTPSELKDVRRDDSTRRQSHAEGIDTPYETSENSSKKSVGSDYTTPKHSKESIRDFNPNTTKTKKKRSEMDNRAKHFDINPNSRKHKSQTAFETVESAWSTSSFHSLSGFRDAPHSNAGYSDNQTDRRIHKTDKKIHHQRREEIDNEQSKRVEPKNYENHREAVKHSKNRKSKREINELDQDFIADIIKRQYKPVQMFGRKSSSISQFSEPMCRDREYTPLNEKIPEDTELCSCCYGGHHSPKHHRRSYERDAKSVCERNTRFKYHRVYTDAYNDSEFYDLIPVKEKSSPKTRRKFAQDNFDNYHDYREVPPSPRTHRPRLNLKAQYYTGSENDIDFVRHHNTRVSPKRHNKYHEPIEVFESDYSSQILIPKKNKQRQKLHSKPKQVHEIGTVSSLQCPNQFDIEQNNTTVDTVLNNTQESVTSTDKTDRTLFEIKDILQSFLQEIKKESSSSGKSDVSSKITENCVSNTIPPASVNPNSGHSFNNYAPQCSAAPTPYIMPPYPNPCCYPVLPMYSMNCMQNGYVMPSQSFTCCCAAKAEDTTDKNKGNNTTASNDTLANDTDELIKEIYKFVAQSPTFSRKQDDSRNAEHETKKCFDSIVYTSRSAGDSTRISKHDAKVGTPVLRCVSKSCEALGSRMASDAYYSETNRATTYSDSVATASFVSDLSNEPVDKNQMSQPNTKIGKMLRSFGIFKKKKAEAIEEVSESESTIDVEILKKPPFRQEYASYMMTNQVYDRPPPNPYEYRHPQYPHDYRPPYDPAMQNFPPPSPNEPYFDPRVHQPEPPRVGGPQYYPGHPSAPPYMNPYENFNQMQPQVPVCLKEIEVKSMATQSEQKISFFRKLKKKMQPPVEHTKSREADHEDQYASQTARNKPGLWKSLQARAESKNDRLTYSLQNGPQGFDAGTKLRNAMIKKMFYKRNPFSPKNLIIKTLLGKDKANYEPPKTRHAPFFIMS